MNYRFLGKPPANVEHWMKTHEPTPPGPTPAFDGDIFTKYNGDIVKVPYDASKTTLNIDLVADKENVRHFDFGKSYTEIGSLQYAEKEHGIDLSRSSLDKTSFTVFALPYSQLTSLSLPASLTSVYDLQLNNNQLSDFLLPAYLESFNALNLEINSLTSFSLPDSLSSFNALSLNGNCLRSFSLPDSIVSFNTLQLIDNSLTSFSLPDSLSSFNVLYLNGNCLRSFSLPDSLTSFDTVNLRGNYLTSFSLPASLVSFNELHLDNGCILDMTHVTDGSQIPEIAGYGIETDIGKENTVIKVKDEEMESTFRSTQNWEPYQYIIGEE